MTLYEFMQQQVLDLRRVPKNVESFGRISVVEYGTYLFYFVTRKTPLLGQHPILKEGIKTKDTFQKGPVRFAFLRFHREQNKLAKQRL